MMAKVCEKISLGVFGWEETRDDGVLGFEFQKNKISFDTDCTGIVTALPI